MQYTVRTHARLTTRDSSQTGLEPDTDVSFPSVQSLTESDRWQGSVYATSERERDSRCIYLAILLNIVQASHTNAAIPLPNHIHASADWSKMVLFGYGSCRTPRYKEMTLFRGQY